MTPLHDAAASYLASYLKSPNAKFGWGQGHFQALPIQTYMVLILEWCSVSVQIASMCP